MSIELPVNLRHLEGTDNRLLDMVVVIPVARCEWHLAMKLLAWIDCLRDSPEIIVYCAPKVSEIERAALGKQTSCLVVHATHFKDESYFGGANEMMKGALDWCEANRPGKAMLWMEADCVPASPGWFHAILDEYRGCGQPFMGDVHLCALDHLTGNAVYSPDWRRIAPALAALPGPDREWGWDSMAASDTLTRAHRAKTIQQIWRPPLPITAAWVKANIRPETALFHQQKDGSLIDVLCDAQKLPRIPLHAQLEESTYAKGRQTPEDPELVKRLSPQQRVIVGLPSDGGVPATGILIISCLKDMEFLKYCLKSIDKHCRGFTEIVVAVEENERRHFSWIKKTRVHAYTPAHPEKGMLSHEVVKCRADEIMPNCEAIVLVDSDCIFWRPTTPADYFVNGKLKLLRERYAELRNPLRKNWQVCVEKSLGFKPEYETMVAHCYSYWRQNFAALRKAVEKHTGEDFDAHVVSGKNDFQQEFAEMSCLGAIAIRDFRHRYHCIDYSFAADAREVGLPATAEGQYIYRRERDAAVEVWSHAGIGRYKSDIECWLRGQVPEYWIK